MTKKRSQGWKAQGMGAGGNSIEDGPVPCYYFDRCKKASVTSKQGKSLCRACASQVQGVEYPLRVLLTGELRRMDWQLEIMNSVPRV